MFILRIRNWDKFQHYKRMHSKYKKQMTWLKLYGGDILNDPEWFDLTDSNKAIYIELLCLASQFEGNLPPMKTIKFRLRRSEDEINNALKDLSHWIEQGVYTTYIPEEKRIEEKINNTSSKDDGQSLELFDKFWKIYPNKRGVAKAKETWKKKNLFKHFTEIEKHIKFMLDSGEWKEKKYIPHGSTYLNQRRWEDGVGDIKQRWEGGI